MAPSRGVLVGDQAIQRRLVADDLAGEAVEGLVLGLGEARRIRRLRMPTRYGAQLVGDRTREATPLHVNSTLGAMVTTWDEWRSDQAHGGFLDTTARHLEQLGRAFHGPRHEADSSGPLPCGRDWVLAGSPHVDALRLRARARARRRGSRHPRLRILTGAVAGRCWPAVLRRSAGPPR